MFQRLFNTGDDNNIDHNPNSATATDYFHGTGMSLMRHPSHTNDGLDHGKMAIGQDRSSAKSVTPLSLEYTSVSPAVMKKPFTKMKVTTRDGLLKKLSNSK